MPNRRQFGRDTFDALRTWDSGATNAELLCAQIVNFEGYSDIDPSHPFGGPDGTKDLVFRKDGITFVGAVYFPKSQKSFSEIKKKFVEDFAGVKKNKAQGIIFLTNQKLTVSEKHSLTQFDSKVITDVYHLERIAQILNYPANYGIRQEFLEISMTQEELVALYKQRDDDYLERLTVLADRVEGFNTGGNSFPFIYFGNNANPIKVGDKPPHYLKAIGGFPLYDINGGISYKETKLMGSLHSARKTLDQIFGGADAYTKVPVQSFAPPGYAIGLGRTGFRMKKSCLIKVHLHSRNGIFNQYLRLEEVGGSLQLKESLSFGSSPLGTPLKIWKDTMTKGDLFNKHLC